MLKSDLQSPFDNYFRKVWNFKHVLNFLERKDSKLEFEHKFCIFFVGNQESYCRLNQSHQVTQNKDSNYVLMERRKNGSLTIRTRIWLGNIFHISQDR